MLALGGLSDWSLFWSKFTFPQRVQINGALGAQVLGRGPRPDVASDCDLEAECSRHSRRSGPAGDGWARASPATGPSRSAAPNVTKPPHATGGGNPRQELDGSLDRTRVVELSWTGALIGLAVGVTTVPLAAALVASPPVGSGARHRLGSEQPTLRGSQRP